MTTTREIFDYFAAKYPGVKLYITHVCRNDDVDIDYHTVTLDGRFDCTGNGKPGIPELIARVEAAMPTPEQKRAFLEYQKAELKAKSDSIAAEIAALETKETQPA